MGKRDLENLSRREREMMDIIYAGGRASAAQVRDGMASPPSYSAVRATLRVLVDKGHLIYRQDGPRYVYRPIVPRDRARQSALKHMVHTFFDNSTQNAVAALLDMDTANLTKQDLERLAEMIAKARREDR